jgi:16S rRNA processing protein RimM
LELEVLESDLPQLPEGEYYHYQLIGCTVFDLSGHEIGTLSGIMETGANDVYIVSNDAGRETMVPATKDAVKEVDTVERRVTVDLPQVATAKPE